jgi:predicted amidophosphoribosyltransferase
MSLHLLDRSRLPPGLARFATALGAIGGRGLDILYPPACLVCRKATAAHHALCPVCWGETRFIERPYCERLGTPFAQDMRAPGLISSEAMADPPVFARARGGSLRRWPSAPDGAPAKIQRSTGTCPADGAWMARSGAEILSEADLIVPVPLHRLRLLSRRFNQAATLAHCVSEACAVPVDTQALVRVKQTPPQVGLSRPATRRQRAGRVPGPGGRKAETLWHADRARR